MERVTLDEKMTIGCLEGFHVMTEEERSKMSMLEEGQWVGLSDPDRHILVTVGWKPVKGLASMLKGKSLAENMEKQVRRAMSPFGYTSEGPRERLIAGSKAYGFGYGYAAGDIDMVAESYVLKIDKVLYYFHFYARAALKKESLPVWKEMLESVQVK